MEQQTSTRPVAIVLTGADAVSEFKHSLNAALDDEAAGKMYAIERSADQRLAMLGFSGCGAEGLVCRAFEAIELLNRHEYVVVDSSGPGGPWKAIFHPKQQVLVLVGAYCPVGVDPSKPLPTGEPVSACRGDSALKSLLFNTSFFSADGVAGRAYGISRTARAELELAAIPDPQAFLVRVDQDMAHLLAYDVVILDGARVYGRTWFGVYFPNDNVLAIAKEAKVPPQTAAAVPG